MRSAASRGPIDLLAVNKKERLAIQVKAGRRRLSKGELAEIYRAGRLFAAKPMLAMKHNNRWWLWLIGRNLDVSRVRPLRLWSRPREGSAIHRARGHLGHKRSHS
jgi:Holliday junction resolvase